MPKKRTGLLIVCLLAGWSASASAGLISIPTGSLLPDALTQDFNTAPVGGIAGNSNIFTSVGLSNVSLTGTFSSGDALTSGEFGNALVSQGGGGGTLSIAAPGDAMDNMSSSPSGFIFSVNGTATQFAFRIVDQINFSMTVEAYSNNALTGSIGYNPSGSFPNPIVAFQSDSPFDEFRLVSGSVGGWGVDDLTLAGFSVVPIPATLPLIGLGLTALGWFRRKKP